MAEIVRHIMEAQNVGTINIYAVKYNQRRKDENVAVALPGNLNVDLRKGFCQNPILYKDAREVNFNPTLDGLEEGTYEFIPLDLDGVHVKWEEILALLENALDYRGNENKEKVRLSNLYVCALDYNNHRYYLCAQQSGNSERVLRGKYIFMEQQDELKIETSNKIFVMGCYVGFIIDPVENKILIFDKKAFQAIFKYDDYQREMVQREIGIVDQWTFLSNSELIRSKSSQKNVYHSLAKVFSDTKYLEEIKRTTPAQLKANLLSRSPQNFTEDDFDGDQLVVTQQNLDMVMKMLAKGFKFNFFTNAAEQQ